MKTYIPLFFALFCLANIPPLSGQITYVTENIWTGAGGNNRWDDPANWFTGAVPDANTYINIKPGLHPITFDLTDMTGTFQAHHFDLNDRANGAIVNIRGVDTGTATMDFTGPTAMWYLHSGGVPTSGINIDDLPQVIFNIGENGVLKFSMISSGTLGGNDFSRYNGDVVHVRLTDNAVFDISERIWVDSDGSGTSAPRRAQAAVSMLQAAAGTTIKLGRNPLRIGDNYSARAVSVAEIAGSMEAADGGILIKSDPGTLIISGQNYFGYGEYETDLRNNNLLDDNGFLVTGTVSDARNATRNIIMSQVANGVMVMDSNIGDTRVAGANAILAGHGRTGSLIVELGTVTGGAGRNSPDVGTLTVDGNFEMRDTGTTTMWIDIGKNGAYDHIHVSGSAVIGGSGTSGIEPILRLWVADGSIVAGDYKFLTSDAVISGTFAKSKVLIPESLTLAPADSGNPVTLSADRKTMSVRMVQLPFSEVEGLSAGQMKVAGYLDYLVSLVDSDDPGSSSPLIGVMNGKASRGFYEDAIDREASLVLLADAMNQLTPMAYTPIYQAAVAGMNTLAEGVGNRVGLAFMQPFRDMFSLYSNYEYSASRTEATLDTESAKLDTSYYTIGGSKSVGENFMIGAELTVGDGNYIDGNDGSRTKANSYTVGIFGAWKYKKLILGGLALFGSDSYDAKRSVQKTGQADYVYADIDGSRNGLGAWLAYGHDVGSFTFRPYGAMHWMNWTMNRFEEKGPSTVALAVEKQQEDLIQSRLGLRMEKALFAQNHQNSLFHLFLDAAWICLLSGADSRTVRTSLEGYSVDAVVPEMSASGVRATLGMSAALNHRWTFQFGATAQRDAGFDTQYNYHATIGYKF
ncbi:MAG: autotransporter outer membrane beta-barrel domain-containing protein [Opitutaceae bacterium]|jgi:outer membrane autotransporter protein|nr:autotransporter outer membrane beta-barrel domain-containing protein [Opitutaceae bacterium]